MRSFARSLRRGMKSSIGNAKPGRKERDTLANTKNKHSRPAFAPACFIFNFWRSQCLASERLTAEAWDLARSARGGLRPKANAAQS